ncbi:MAG: prepilin-type N-terminal cleavage/methylation domain-containing protein [Candidatus Omnitrophica bacterium]|nr:prepilin-type N-terminal cleavage/methylation domain-containing protein [Candidatus Omnitrophota bacterium]
MKRGFTLLELIVVIIILGVLATLGFQQYGRMIEKSRGAEARAVLGALRTQAAAYRMENGTLAGFTPAIAGIGTAANQIPGPAAGNCQGTHYFWYNLTVADPVLTATATRCIANGKIPQGATALTLVLASNLATGSDTWSGTGGY